MGTKVRVCFPCLLKEGGRRHVMHHMNCTWLSVAPAPPRRWDLRVLNWQVFPQFRVNSVAQAAVVLLDWRVGFRCSDWLSLPRKCRTIVLGVDRDGERARLLQLGYGAVLHGDTPIEELASRLGALSDPIRVADRAPSHREKPISGSARLDLVEAFNQYRRPACLRIHESHAQHQPRYH